MRALIQRVLSSKVYIEDKKYSSIENGLLIFLGITHNDDHHDIINLVNKIINLRIFPSKNKNIDKSIIDTKGSILVVSQFTLYGDCTRGRRPSFINAESSEKAEVIYLDFINEIKSKNIIVSHGKFGSNMDIHLINSGPVTLLLES